jgi:predicted ATPase
MMLDRLAERAALDQLLSAARARQSSTLVLCGETGIGKTALLDYAIESASGFQVVLAVGVESEMELAYAALQQLCAPMLDHVDHLPSLSAMPSASPSDSGPEIRRIASW